MILHDYYNSDPERARDLLIQLRKLLKPGGIVGVIDHVGDTGRENRRFHRMEKSQALNIAEQAGYLVIDESDLLRNPNDRHVRSIFDPMLKRDTDRFLLKFGNPE